MIERVIGGIPAGGRRLGRPACDVWERPGGITPQAHLSGREFRDSRSRWPAGYDIQRSHGPVTMDAAPPSVDRRCDRAGDAAGPGFVPPPPIHTSLVTGPRSLSAAPVRRPD